MTDDRNFPDQPAQYVNKVDGQDGHHEGNEKVFPFTQDIKCGDDDSERESNRDESADVTHAFVAWIIHGDSWSSDGGENRPLKRRSVLSDRPWRFLSLQAPSPGSGYCLHYVSQLVHPRQCYSGIEASR